MLVTVRGGKIMTGHEYVQLITVKIDYSKSDETQNNTGANVVL